MWPIVQFVSAARPGSRVAAESPALLLCCSRAPWLNQAAAETRTPLMRAQTVPLQLPTWIHFVRYALAPATDVLLMAAKAGYFISALIDLFASPH